MGFYISKISDTKLGTYIGSATMYAVAESGAFDAPVSQDGENLLNENDSIFVVVEKSGIQHCINTLQTKTIVGRDVGLLLNEINNNYQDGFKITG